MDILLCGCCGYMGKVVTACVDARSDCRIVAGVDLQTDVALPFPVFAQADQCTVKADVIIDFSFHAAIREILEFAVSRKIPAVIATTGFTNEELQLIEEAEKQIPVFRSANMSLGINLICELAKQAARFLPDLDIEIIEKHHNQKVDSPSGTALMIADEISSVLPAEMEYVHGRSGICGKRTKNEIGIHAVRGGTIVGEHEVLFAGKDEMITLTHTATSREIFANGALKAAHYLPSKPAGRYDMSDLINGR